VEGINTSLTANRIAPFAIEASWATGRWETLRKYIGLYTGEPTEEFNLGIGQALLQLKEGDKQGFQDYIQMMRDKVASELSQSSTSSFRACHDARLKCHVLSDLEIIASHTDSGNTQQLLVSLERRLEILGAYVTDKQYLLGIRRAAMEVMRLVLDSLLALRDANVLQSDFCQWRYLTALVIQCSPGKKSRLNTPIVQRCSSRDSAG
jgi:serine/threonine-protein kinase ATR